MDFFSVKHSYNAGDLIILLPSIKEYCRVSGKQCIIYQRLDLPAYYYEGAVHPVSNSEGQNVCMNKLVFDRLMPLIAEQIYIREFNIWQGQSINFDIDNTRFDKLIPMPAGNIHLYPSHVYPLLSPNLTDPWLSVYSKSYANSTQGDIKITDKIIINRTLRYQNPYITYFFLNKYQDHLVFAGLLEEYNDFCKRWDLNIPLLIENDFLEVARNIASCKAFIGNQSVSWHIADALKVPRILELCPQFPHVFPTGKEGYSFYHQQSLEYYFNTILK